MILGLTVLDVALLLLLVVFLVQGHRRGLGVVLGGLLGFAGGAVIAFYAVPVVSAWAVGSPWRWALVLGATLALVASGQHVGAEVGAQLRLRIGPPALRRVDRALGALAAVLVAALVMGLLSFSLGALGSTVLTREVARSRVLTVIDAAMPDPVLAWAARSRSAVAGLDGLPEMRLPAPRADAAGPTPGGASSPSAPGAATPSRPSGGDSADPSAETSGGSAGSSAETSEGAGGSSTATPDGASAPSSARPSGTASSGGTASSDGPAAGPTAGPASGPGAPGRPAAPSTPQARPAPSSAAPPGAVPSPAPAPAADISRAVVRLTGTAAACSQVQSGSGVAVAPDRVLTNAHVVMGVEAPTVLDRDRGVHEARVVLLDTRRDIAVLAVDGADLPVARLGRELRAGDAGLAMGYPDSGPFATTAARVDAVGEVSLEAVGGGAVSAVDVYTLAADIRHGYSGGPVAAADGTLAGLVFARAPGSDEIGYALTADALADAVAAAPRLSATVPSGTCLVGG